MNKIILMGRLTRDPDVRYSAGDNPTAIAHFSIAVDRRFKRDGQPTADFFNCTAFGRQGEFVEKYLRKGIKVVVEGRLQNDNYQNREGQMVYRDQIVVENLEFAESKAVSQQNAAGYQAPAGGNSAPASSGSAPRTSEPDTSADGFMNIPEGISEELPFT